MYLFGYIAISIITLLIILCMSRHEVKAGKSKPLKGDDVGFLFMAAAFWPGSVILMLVILCREGVMKFVNGKGED